ncbi:GYF domain-containing protein [Haloferula sp.]|uniref:GYF domain-containing protein n=1 Tax=Haloferula sp. TaxID=2497595 RepID=UPI00329ED821
MSQWYYAHDGKQSGPVPISELQRLAADGGFDPEKDLVWQEGLPDWKPASTVPELSSLMPGAAAPEPTVASSEGVPTSPEASPSSPASPYEAPRTTSAHPTPAPAPMGNMPPSNGLAIASLICGLVAFLTCFVWCLSIPLAIAAIITGHMASARIKTDPGKYTGKGLARAGLITGYLGLLLTVVYTACIMYIATRSPEQLQEMDWLPAEFSERFTEEMERQRAKQGN